MKISDCMKRTVFSSSANVTIRTAAQEMIQNHIGTLPIVDENSRLIGIMGTRDLITLAMPGFIHLVENVDYIHDFGAAEDEKPGPEILDMPVSQIMREPICVDSEAGLVRALALLQEHTINDLPVVDADMRLVGIASYIDIGVALMSNWNLDN
jgi:CBS-domain-containing membrane protein